MHKRLLTGLAVLLAGAGAGPRAPVLEREVFRHYVEEFNAIPSAGVESYVSDERAWGWLKDNVPFFVCPDVEVERTYYYRWWSLRKHIRQTPAGFILTEFLRPVNHATDYNAISCALGHHVAEGRWLRDPSYLDQYIDFWLRSGENGGLQRHLHQYSGWTAAAVYDRWLVDARTEHAVALLDALILDYKTWEKERLLENGLFWQYDVRDGMEESVSGSRKEKNARPTINSYMYGNAMAIAQIARLAGKPEVARRLRNLGFHIISTGGTYRALRATGIEAEHIAKIQEGSRPNILDKMKNREVLLVINTPSRRGPHTDEARIRAFTVTHRIPCITNLSAAKAVVHGIAALKSGALRVRALQDYHRAPARK